MPYQALEINRDGEIAWLTLNRPQALNALNAMIVDELHDYLRELYHERKTRVVAMRGAGPRRAVASRSRSLPTCASRANRRRAII